MFLEEYKLIVGRKFAGWYLGRGIQDSKSVRTYGSVSFDWGLVEQYEDNPKWDVIGFWHTHPPGVGSSPSQTDYNTMDGLVNALGRPLLCAISCNGYDGSYWFIEKQEDGTCIQNFKENNSRFSFEDFPELYFDKVGNFFYGQYLEKKDIVPSYY